MMGAGVDVKPPVQARREAQDGPGTSGCAVRATGSSHPAGSFEHRRTPAGRVCWVSFLLVTFLLTSKEK